MGQLADGSHAAVVVVHPQVVEVGIKPGEQRAEHSVDTPQYGRVTTCGAGERRALVRVPGSCGARAGEGRGAVGHVPGREGDLWVTCRRGKGSCGARAREGRELWGTCRGGKGAVGHVPGREEVSGTYAKVR